MNQRKLYEDPEAMAGLTLLGSYGVALAGAGIWGVYQGCKSLYSVINAKAPVVIDIANDNFDNISKFLEGLI